MKKAEITEAVGTIGYDILDSFIAPLAGISSVVADLYLASPSDYLDGKELTKAMKKIIKEYEIDNADQPEFPFADYLSEMPLALIALYIMENGNYFKK